MRAPRWIDVNLKTRTVESRCRCLSLAPRVSAEQGFQAGRNNVNSQTHTSRRLCQILNRCLGDY